MNAQSISVAYLVVLFQMSWVTGIRIAEDSIQDHSPVRLISYCPFAYEENDSLQKFVNDSKLFSISALASAGTLLVMFVAFQRNRFPYVPVATVFVISSLSLAILTSIGALLIETNHVSGDLEVTYMPCISYDCFQNSTAINYNANLAQAKMGKPSILVLSVAQFFSLRKF